MTVTDKYIQTIRKCLPEIQKNFGVTGLAIFGSVARGDARNNSDLDIIVDMPPRLLLVSGLRDYLEQLLNVSVDLVRRHSHLSPSFLTQISQDAITVL